ncbi:serine/threonine-protein kinase 17B-like [Chelonus insularis]|uniref:serine/threonine-protein kinase 17B-like n=1 Tax=Chelonus insularis TaxID=460826 RepID=UPI00158F27D0|nr:serine/threonine-protein kinase 17B-like [Chelonus insularis]
MTVDRLFETTSIPGHLAPTPERLERLLSKQKLEELYEVEEQPFARGKYATVKRCRERSSGQHWAAKFLKKRRRAQELKAEALHEVAVLDAAAHCPQLVSLHQVFETNSEMVLVLELAPGGELQMVLDRDEIPEERQVVRLLRQILDGVAFLHSINIAHLDIKPQNLVMTGEFPDCDVKLCDFGISRHISQDANIREILGTPDYIAPEVLNYEPISLATDMWSVGVLLYVLLTGCSPFGGDTKQETFCNISRCHLDFPHDLFEDVSEEARDLMSKLMVKDASQRLTVTECLQHPWFSLFNDPETTLLTTSSSEESEVVEENPTNEDVYSDKCSSSEITTDDISHSTEANDELEISECLSNETEIQTTELDAVTLEATADYSKPTLQVTAVKLGLSPNRKDTFKKNMESLAQKFSETDIFIIEQNNSSSRTTETTVSETEVFKCTPVFILGEEQQYNDSGSDTVSEISTDSASDRSSIYSDDSLDFILYGKSQGRASFPFTGTEMDRWERHHPRAWSRECNGVVNKALSRFTIESVSDKLPKIIVPSSNKGKTGLEALRERGSNLVVIREPVKAGRYTRYSEVQCESVQARIRRFQVEGGS